MSLINQMLQDLEARRSDVAGSDSYGQQIRAVLERRRIHPAWWIALVFAIVSSGLFAWMWMRPAAPVLVQSGQHLPLKFDTGLSLAPGTVASPQEQRAVTEVHELVTNNPAENGALPIAAPPMPAAAPEHTPVLPQPVRPEPPKAVNAEAGSPRMPREVQVPVLPELDKMIVTSKARAAPAAPSESLPVSASPKHVKELSPQQRAENEYRKGLTPMQQGKMPEAIDGMEQALQIDPHHIGARRALIGALLEEKRLDEALQRAREGLELDPAQPDLAMILARLQLDKGELKPAIGTLERTLVYGADRADYQAFLAALLQRDERHKQAVEHYLLALQKAPQNGVWWMGLGISLQANRQLLEAQEAYQRAKATNTLSPELLAFVDSRLGQIRR